MSHPSSRSARRAAPYSALACLPPVLGLALALMLAVLLLLPMAAVHGQGDRLTLAGDEQALKLDAYLRLLRDPDGTLTPERALERAADFAPAPRRESLSLGYSEDTVWLRLELQSRASASGDWRIEFAYPPLDRIELFDYGADGLRWQIGGDTVAYAQRSHGHRAPLFAVQLEAGERRTLLFRVHSAGSLTLDARLWSAEHYDSHRFASTFLQALYFGMLLTLASYNLLLSLTQRDSSFLYYVLFTLCLGGVMLGFSGLGAQHLWPQGGAWGNRALPFFLALANACGAQLARSFLDTARHAPFWHRLLGIDIVLQLLATLATLLLPTALMLQTLSLSGTGNLLLLLLCGIASMRRRLPAAPLYVAASLLLLGGEILLALRNLGLLPSGALVDNALQIGSAPALLLLAFGLAERLDLLKRRNSEAQRHSLHALQEQERLLEQRVAERTEALAAANERLRALALSDPLTGLANRMAMRQHLEQAWRRACRRNEMLALIMLDLDDFKPVNDHYGHEAGDLLLIEVARRLQASARATDLVARLGGDEFVLVCESIGSRQQAEALAGRILESLAQPIRLQAQDVHIGASIGISFGLDCDSGDDLLREADQAMYRAKAAGRNCMHLGRYLDEGQIQDTAAPDEL